MTKYYYLGSLLPELRLGEKPEISLEEYEQLLKDNLSASDYLKISKLKDLSTPFRRGSNFLSSYLIMEKELRFILAALRAKKLNRDITLDLQYEDPGDPLIAQILAQKDSPSYTPPENYQEIKSMFDSLWHRPMELQMTLKGYIIKQIHEMVGIDPFSFDRMVAYLAELIVVEGWWNLNHTKGLEIIDHMLKEIE